MTTTEKALSAPRRAAERLVEYVNSEQFMSVGDLFAEDAVWLTPNNGPTITGRERIREHYNALISPMKPKIRIATYLEQGRECTFALEAAQPDGSYRLGAMDHFTLNDEGLIERFVVYVRGGPSTSE